MSCIVCMNESFKIKIFVDVLNGYINFWLGWLCMLCFDQSCFFVLVEECLYGW